MTSGSLVERLNFGVALSANRFPGTTIDAAALADGNNDPDYIVDRAVQLLLGGDVSQQTRKILVEQVRTSGEPPVAKAIALVLGSPEFQKR
jgi:hypothetical protein